MDPVCSLSLSVQLPKAYLIPSRYYHTLFTHSLPKALRTMADDTPTCVDILMNFLVATVTKLPPIKVPYGRQHQEAVPLVSDSGDWAPLGKHGLGGGGRGRGHISFTVYSKSLLLRQG